jgi:NADH-quinone oxidoreductase subunit C
VRDLLELLRDRFVDVLFARGEATVVVGRDDLLEALGWLRAEPGVSCDFLSCITATDWPGEDPRFWVSYELRSMELKHRVRVKVGLPEDDPHVPSVTGIFPTANWLERETFDFYGVVFDGHPDLTRIMMPDDWEGYPLRKDEELGGVPTWFHGASVPPIDKRGMA